MRAMDPCLDGLVAVAEILEGFGLIPDVQDKLLDVNQDIKQGFDCLRPRCAGRRLSKFTNVHHRMEFVRCRKLIKSIRKASARTSDKLRSLGVVWNQKMGLRYGDQHHGDVRRARAKGRHLFVSRSKRKLLNVEVQSKQRPRMNEWDVVHVIQQGFAGVGRGVDSRSRTAEEVGKAHGGSKLLALASVAAMTKASLSKRLDDFVETLKRKPGCSGKSAFLASHYDCTPFHVRFGVLADVVSPHARYLRFNEHEDRWEALPARKFVETTGRELPQHGVVEILAQQMEVHCRTQTGRMSRTVLVGPRILQNQRASCLITAVNKGVPQFSIDALNKMCAEAGYTGYLIFMETPDNAKACKRKVYATMQRLNKSQRVLFVAGGCAAHKLQRIVLHQEGAKTMVGDLYAIKYVAESPAVLNRLRRVLEDMVEEELDIIPSDKVSEADAAKWLSHTNEVLEHTLLRQLHHTRARLDQSSGQDCDAVFEDGVGKDSLLKRKSMILEMCNGDIKRRRFCHIEKGCCPGGRTEACEKYVGALEEGVGILMNKSGRPAEGKWGSMSKSNAEFQLADMVHGAFHRVFLRAFSNAQPPDDADDDDDYRVVLTRKLHRVKTVMEDDARRARAAQHGYCLEPLDWMLQRVQWLDVHSKPLWDVLRPSSCPFRRALADWTSVLLSPCGNSSISSLVSHLQYVGESEVVDEIQEASLLTDLRRDI